MHCGLTCEGTKCQNEHDHHQHAVTDLDRDIGVLDPLLHRIECTECTQSTHQFIGRHTLSRCRCSCFLFLSLSARSMGGSRSMSAVSKWNVKEMVSPLTVDKVTGITATGISLELKADALVLVHRFSGFGRG